MPRPHPGHIFPPDKSHSFHVGAAATHFSRFVKSFRFHAGAAAACRAPTGHRPAGNIVIPPDVVFHG